MAASRFPITDRQIDDLVRAFYARVRKDGELGPVFLRAVGTSEAAWRAHEARIASFWRNALGMDRSFSGNPMMAHLRNGDVVPEQFPVWLSLFRETADDILPEQAARGISDLAERIGRSLAMGLKQFRTPEDPPALL